MVAIVPLGDPAGLHAAAAAVRSGALIGFATDTVYGVGGDLEQPAVITALYALKGRQAEKALPVLLASAAQLRTVARAVPDGAWHLIEAFWPGALTIVLPRHPAVSDLVGKGNPTIGVRVPGHRGLLRLLETLGTPLVSSSANLSGQPSALDAEGVAAMLGTGLGLILDGGRLAPAPPSTVIDMTGDLPGILREGAVSPEAIARVLGQAPLLRTTA